MRSPYKSLWVTGFFAFSVAGSQVNAEVPYDYYSAAQCHAYDGSYLDSMDGALTNLQDPSVSEAVCPVVRIYPRHPGRLRYVRVSLSLNADAPYFSRSVSVCAKGFWHSGEAVCDTKTVGGSGFRTVAFERDELRDVRGVPYGWAQYMYVVVQQSSYDKLYGYEVQFDLD